MASKLVPIFFGFFHKLSITLLDILAATRRTKFYPNMEAVIENWITLIYNIHHKANGHNITHRDRKDLQMPNLFFFIIYDA